MKTKYFALLALSLVLAFSADAMAIINYWKTYTGNMNINSMTHDGQNLWIATNGGLVKFDKSSSLNQVILHEDGLPENAVTSVALDQNGTKWVGTRYAGVGAF